MVVVLFHFVSPTIAPAKPLGALTNAQSTPRFLIVVGLPSCKYGSNAIPISFVSFVIYIP